jgi:hypothetical protein
MVPSQETFALAEPAKKRQYFAARQAGQWGLLAADEKKSG